MKKRKKNSSRGAVSIFITLVLVPCIAFTCVFGDISRVQLSAMTAESTADLALNGLLTQYDVELQEYYGLMASCQTIDQYYDKTKEYFTAMFQEKGISEEGTQLFNAYLDSLFTDGSTSNFLQADIVGEIAVEPVGEGIGDSATLLEDQIVEFMKYRGPIEITQNVMERFQTNGKLDELLDAAKDEPVVEAKTEYSEAQGELAKAMFATYCAILEYDTQMKAEDNLSFENYDTLENNLNKIREDYKEATNLIVQYYANTDNLQTFQAPVLTLDKSYSSESVGERVEIIKSPKTEEKEEEIEVIYCVKYDDIVSWANSVSSNVNTIREQAEAAYGACQHITNPNSNADINRVQYCVQMDEALSNGNYTENIRNAMAPLAEYYGKLDAMLGCEENPNGSTPGDWKEKINSAKDKIIDIQNTYLSSSGSSDYAKTMALYEGISISEVSTVQARGYDFYSSYLERETTLTTFAASISLYLDELEKDYTKRIEELNIAINGGSVTVNGTKNKVESLDKLKELAQKFKTSRDSWGSAAGNAGTDYGKEQVAEYNATTTNDETKQIEEWAKEIDETKVEELKTRLGNIKEDLELCVKAIQEFKYGGKKISGITTANDAIALAKTKISNSSINLSISENKSYATGCAQELIVPYTETIYAAPENVSERNPDLDIDTPDLYAYMKTQFPNTKKIQEEIDKAESDREGYEKEAEDKAEAAKEPGSVSSNNIVADHKTSSCGALDALTSIVGIVQNIVKGDFTNIRDNIFIAEYIMDMYSYSSFEQEEKYRELDGKYGGESIDSGSASAAYSSLNDEWKNENPSEFMRNKSLTNQMINETNNYAYGAEIEYVLYGGSGKTNKDTLISAYASIYGIRFASNLVSGFRLFYNRSTTIETAAAINIVADLIAAATSGVVPATLTKCVTIGVLATMESANDLAELRLGLPVVLLKTEDTEWYYAVSYQGTEFSFGNQGEDRGTKGIYYSDYLYVFLMLGLEGGKKEDILLRLGEVIQANMRHRSGDVSYDLGAAKMYYRLKGSIRVKPLFMELNILDEFEKIEDVKNSSGWCTYTFEIVRGYS